MSMTRNGIRKCVCASLMLPMAAAIALLFFTIAFTECLVYFLCTCTFPPKISAMASGLNMLWLTFCTSVLVRIVHRAVQRLGQDRTPTTTHRIRRSILLGLSLTCEAWAPKIYTAGYVMSLVLLAVFLK